MVHGFDSVSKKILRKVLNKRPSEDCFEERIRGEFFNGAFKKTLLIFHECPVGMEGSTLITG